MAAIPLTRLSIFKSLLFSSRARFNFSFSPPSQPSKHRLQFQAQNPSAFNFFLPPKPNLRSFTSASSNTNSPVSFNFSDSDDDTGGGEAKVARKGTQTKEIGKPNLPPPYDPFSKKPVIEEPEDPKDLQQIFHDMRTQGLTSSAIKMFDALSKDGLTHQALELFSQIKDKGHMPDVVAHTAVVEAYANAGQTKEAVKVFTRMLASGVTPNAYSYTVLVKGLAAGAKLRDMRKYLMEMMEKGIRPNAATCAAVFEAFVKEDKVEEGREVLEEMKRKGFVPEEKGVREHLSKRGQCAAFQGGENFQSSLATAEDCHAV